MIQHFRLLQLLILATLTSGLVRAEEFPERVLQFAPGTSMGKVLVREAGANGEWRVFGEAFGAAKVPAGHEAALVVKQYPRGAKAPLAPMANLAPNDIQMFVCKGSPLPDAEFVHLKRLTGLRVVRINGATLSARGAENFAPLTELIELDLTGNNIAQQAFPIFAPMTKLRKLSLAGNPISGRSFNEFPLFENLESLDLSGCQLLDEGVPVIARATKLTELKLNRTKISGEGLAGLAGLAALRKLEIAGTHIADADLQSLASLGALAELNLASTKVTDVGIETLSKFPLLRALNLNECSLVTDASVVHLRQMKQLRLLGIHQSGITQAGLTELEDALPECMIVSVTNPQLDKLAEVFSLQ